MDIKIILKLVLILSIATLTTACSKKEEENLEAYSILEGEIHSIDKENQSIVVVSEEDKNFDKLIVNLSEEKSIFNSVDNKFAGLDSLKDGDIVKVVYKNSTPVAMSEPPLMTPDLLVLLDKDDQVFIDIDKYDKDLVNSKNSLSLNLSDTSLIYNLKGNMLEEKDLLNKNLLVLYQASTKSIPAQTSPNAIIILD